MSNSRNRSEPRLIERVRRALDRSRVARAGLGALLSLSFAASVMALAQSTGFAFSRPLARAITQAMFHDDQIVITNAIFRAIDPDWWRANKTDIVRIARDDWQRHDWIVLTDWLWLLPIALLAGSAWNFAFRGRDRAARWIIASMGAATSILALLVYYAWIGSYHWWNTSIHLAEGIVGRPIALTTLTLGWTLLALVVRLDAGRFIARLVRIAQRSSPRA